jgi:hypothetical protein
MMYTFILKNDKTKNYRLVSQLLVVFNLLGFVFLLIKNEMTMSKNYNVFFGILITVVYTFFTVVEWLSKKPLPDFWHRMIFGFCALAWMKEGYWWLSVILLLFIVLDIIAHRKLIVKISEMKIEIPYFPEKKATWNEMSNVVLKDGLLTIDFKNNKILQQLILNSDWDINEKEFNEFCRRQLDK